MLNKAKIISLVVLFSLLITTNAYAFDKTGNVKVPQKNQEVKVPNDSISIIESDTGMLGPVPGWINVGSVNKSSYQNFAQLTIAIAFVAKLNGIPVSDVMGIYGGITLAIQALGYDNVYYRRTEYKSPDGMMYYYRYDYYSDSSHNYFLGNSYSEIYGLWASPAK